MPNQEITFSPLLMVAPGRTRKPQQRVLGNSPGVKEKVELASKKIDVGSRQDYSSRHAAGGLPSTEHCFGFA